MNSIQAALSRVALFWVAFWFLLIGLRFLPLATLGNWDWVLFGILLIGLSLFLITLFSRKEGRQLRDFGLRWKGPALRQLALGTFAGIVMVVLMLGTLALLTPAQIVTIQDPKLLNALGFSALVLFILSLMEEIVFRSYPLFHLSESIETRTAIYTTSVVFAFYHGLDPMNLLGPGVWGLFYGLSALRTGGIAFPAGLHFGLNWMQSLFGLKPQFATSIWMINVSKQGGWLPIESVGLGLQIILLVLGVILIEKHIKQTKSQSGI